MAEIFQIAEKITATINQELNLKKAAVKPYIVAIDGPCASGKSMLAVELQVRFDCPVIKMDHFFLPLELRTPDRLAQAGGNIHYERFENEVLAGLSADQDFKYQIFNCSEMKLIEPVKISPSPLVIIEGSYSLHPKWRNRMDLAIFLRTEKSEQQRRLIERNGLEIYKNFEQKWIPMENHYFSENKICKSADLVFTSG